MRTEDLPIGFCSCHGRSDFVSGDFAWKGIAFADSGGMFCVPDILTYNEGRITMRWVGRVTITIRTRQCSIKAIFVAFTVALHQQGCRLKTTNLIFTSNILMFCGLSCEDLVLNKAKRS